MSCWWYSRQLEAVSLEALLGYADRCKQRKVEFIKDPLNVEVLLLEAFSQVPGAERCRCRCVFADSTGVVRGFCYKPPQFGEGDTVTLYNYHVEDERIIFHETSESQREMESSIMPPGFIDAAQKMMFSPVNVPMLIRNIIELPYDTKSMVTFEAEIIMIDGPKVIYPAHGKTYLKELICEDISGTVKVCLWNHCSELDYKCGQTVLVKDGRTRFDNYHDEMTVSINHLDEITVLPP